MADHGVRIKASEWVVVLIKYPIFIAGYSLSSRLVVASDFTHRYFVLADHKGFLELLRSLMRIDPVDWPTFYSIPSMIPKLKYVVSFQLSKAEYVDFWQILSTFPYIFLKYFENSVWDFKGNETYVELRVSSDNIYDLQDIKGHLSSKLTVFLADPVLNE